MPAHRDAELARIAASDVSPMPPHVERAAIAVEIATHGNVSTGQVERRLATAQRVRDGETRVARASGDKRTQAQLEADALAGRGLTAEPCRQARESGLRIRVCAAPLLETRGGVRPRPP